MSDSIKLLIGKVIGQDFADFMAQQVLQPQGMAHSSFAWLPSFGTRIPTGYELLSHSEALQQTGSCGPVDITLGGAPAVCQSFSALISAADRNSYTIDFKWNDAPTSAWDIMLENPDGSL